MKKLKPIAALLVMLLLFQSCLIAAQASTIEKKSSFEYKVVSADAGSAPGNMLVQLYIQSDPKELITTAGAALVINTDYVDIVNKKGEAITDKYKSDLAILDKSFTGAASPIGAEKKSFSQIKGMSIASYNASTGNMYIFLCGMAMEGIQVPEKSLMASYYLKTKSDAKLPAGAIRLAKEGEPGKDCPSKAVYVSEISSKKEVGKGSVPITLSVDEALMEPGAAPTSEAQTTEKSTTAATQSEQQSTKAAATSSRAAAQTTARPVSEMSEAELEAELGNKVVAAKALKASDAQKADAVYKAYEKAVEGAEKVLADKNATKEQKQQALETLREAEQTLEQTFPELQEQLEKSEAPAASKSSAVLWLCIGIGVGVIALAVIIIVLIKNKKKQKDVISNP